MRIIVFGASGRTGLELVNQALEQGHNVVAFVRNSAKLRIRHQNLSVFEGDVLNKDQVENAISECDGVLFAIGVNPIKERPICAEGIKNVIAAMKKHSAQRLVVESAYGVKETRKGIYGRLLWIIINEIMRDKEEMEGTIAESQLDWVIVRPTMLTKGSKVGKYRAGENLRLGTFPKISRADVADFMLKQLKDNKYIHQFPTISY